MNEAQATAFPSRAAVTPAPRPSGRTVVANLIVFQACWFACVLGAAHGVFRIGPAAVAAMAVWHLGAVAARPALEMRLIALAVGVGLVFDAVLLHTGAVTFPGGWWLPGLAPLWMQALWALFAMSLNVSLRWLKGRPWLAAMLGGVVGPISFWGGVRLGGASLPAPLLATGLLAIGWAVVMPLLVRAGERWDGVR